MTIKITTKLKEGQKAVAADGLELSARHRRMLQRAEQLKMLKGKGVMKRRKEAASLIRQVEAERDYQHETRDVQAGLAETMQIAAVQANAPVEQAIVEERVTRAAFARGGDHGELQCIDGEPVLVVETVIHKRIRDRDGLRTLIKDGKLTQRERLTGEAIRYLVENVPGHLGSCLEERARSGGASRSDPFVAAALQRAYLGVVLTNVERAFARRADGVAELRVLRAVAGEGASLRSLGEGPNVRKANLARLKRALAVADEAISAIRSTGGLRIRSA